MRTRWLGGFLVCGNQNVCCKKKVSLFSGFYINHITLESYAGCWDRSIFLLPVSCQTYIFEYLKWDIFSYSILLPGKKSKYWAVQFVIEQNQFNTKLDCTMYIWANSITSLFQQEIVRLAAYPLQCRVWGSIRNLSASHAYRGWIICTVLFDHTARPWLS